MKYTTSITKVEQVEVDVCPKKVLKELLSRQYRKLPCFGNTPLDRKYYYVKQDQIIRVDVKEGYSHGHYEMDDEHYEKDITSTVTDELLDVIIAHATVLDTLEEK